MPAAERQALKVTLESLGEFKKRVDTALSNFENSQGSAQKVGEHRLSEASFKGVGRFDEATGLHAAYENVHERLTTLSRNLGLQIEALQIAVNGARGNFNDIEEEQRRRFWEIQTEIGRQEEEAQREKAAADAAKHGEPVQKRSNDKQAGGGL